MLFVNNFEYDGIKSAQYGLAFRHIDTERFKKICGDFKYKTAYYPSLNKSVVTDVGKEESAPEFDVEFICENPINDFNAKQIKKWLFDKPTFRKLYQDYRSDKSVKVINQTVVRDYLECVFYNAEEIRYAGGLYGWKCSCLLSSPVAFQDEIEYEYTDFTNDITIEVNSDLTDYIYPTLVLTASNETNPIDVTIKNVSDDNRSVALEGITALTEIYMDCPVGSVIDSTGKSLLDNLLDRKFLRLLPDENVLQISGVDSMKIKWQNVRYIL
jgi:hypothetical protein